MNGDSVKTSTNNGSPSNAAAARTTTGSGPQRANKPRPLVLSPTQGSGLPPFGSSTQPMTMEEVLELMQIINSAVRAGQFSNTLSSQIFRLCAQLKISGECLEISHKNELNKVFVALRQACCRDAGQLGTPCRLKIMELVELRAMGWRPSLSHSQYYLNRQPQSPTPVSAPPFGAVPINPFAGPPPPGLAGAPGMALAADANSAAASYYLIPASAGFFSGGGPAWGAFPPGSPLTGSTAGGGNTTPHTGFQTPATPLSAALPEPSPLPDTPWPRGAVIKPSPKFPRPAKIPGKNQYRHEIVIRNADSGKIMGVRGRRVAVVEELSQTVISFQRAASAAAKDRALTITGDTEERIEHARLLIEETIKRNVSPNRPEDAEANFAASATVGSGGEDGAYDDEASGENEETDASSAAAAAGIDKLNIKFEKASDGSVRMMCDDPQVLQAAQDALSQYFVRRAPNRRSGADASTRAARQERRKSVPNWPDVDGEIANMVDGEKKERTVSEADRNMNWRSTATAAASSATSGETTRSTPNLAKSTPVPAGIDPYFDGQPLPRNQSTYTREDLMRLASSSAGRSPPANLEAIQEHAPDLIRTDEGTTDLDKN